MGENYSQQLAAFASALRFEDVPVSVIDHAKLCLLDTLGCGLFGSTLPWSRILVGCAGELEEGGPSTIWGGPSTASPAMAALANGTMVHGFELDDLHKHSILHPGSVVTPSALAVSEFTGGVSGKRFLTALVAGYEVGARVGLSVGVPHLVQGWHPTGTHGTLAAAAAAGSVLGLDQEQMRHALGIAGSQSAGLMASQFASMVKRFHAGRAAQSGVLSGLLARRGFTGIADLFETEYGGYCTTFSPRHDLKALVRGLGTTWETCEVGFKPYSTNGSCHTAIDAVLDLKRAHGFGPEDVEKIHVFTSTATKEHVGWAYIPDSVTTAQMNLSYILAVAISDGEAFVDQFSEARIHDAALVSFSGRVSVVVDPAIDARGDKYRHSLRLEITLKDGRRLLAERDSARGSKALPLTRSEVEAKFEKLARKVLPLERVATLRDLIYNLDLESDVSRLGRMLTSE